MVVDISHFYESLIKHIWFNYKWNALCFSAFTTKSIQHKSICRRRQFRVNGLMPLIYTHKARLRERFPPKHLFCIDAVPDPVLQLWNKSAEKNLQSTVSTILNCYPPITLSTDAPSNRQLVCWIFPLIFHISLWHNIIPDDCLSVMVYDEKCSGPLMWDVSVYHFDGWPPW